MPNTPSTIGLHLRYRIWIAEMNADVVLLRIFDDYLTVLTNGKKDTALTETKTTFEKQFISLRQQMDLLKHEMHLQKMKLAAATREGKETDKKSYIADNHAALKKNYYVYRKAFSNMKKDFGLVKYNWVD